MTEQRHCDTYIDDPRAPSCLRSFLEYNRRPAIEKDGPSPVLFATLRDAVNGERHGPANLDGTPNADPVPLSAGQRVRVVMASRLGDVGITERLSDEHGYVARVQVEDLTDFGEVA